jgi:ERCC4-type nuclease
MARSGKRRNPPIIVDTREQQPWSFNGRRTVTKKLDVGDYSLRGYEAVIVIERKAKPKELITNFGGRDWPRFLRELRKMAVEIEYKAVICEFSMKQLLRCTPIGQVDRWVVLGKLSGITMDLGIPIIFAGTRFNAELTAEMFLSRWASREKRGELLDRGL